MTTKSVRLAGVHHAALRLAIRDFQGTIESSLGLTACKRLALQSGCNTNTMQKRINTLIARGYFRQSDDGTLTVTMAGYEFATAHREEVIVPEMRRRSHHRQDRLRPSAAQYDSLRPLRGSILPQGGQVPLR